MRKNKILFVEIKSGLKARELIVLAGQAKLRNGLAVSATEQQARDSVRVAGGRVNVKLEKEFHERETAGVEAPIIQE